MTAPLPERVRVGKVEVPRLYDNYWRSRDGKVTVRAVDDGFRAYSFGLYTHTENTPELAAAALTARLVELRDALDEVLDG